jgi:hypothetical protein
VQAMAIYYYPTVTEKDYAEFKQLPDNDFPGKFQQWKYERDKIRRRNESKTGESFEGQKGVDVSAVRFQQWCARHKEQRHTRSNLWDFARMEGLQLTHFD